jgi:hypothetical protein
MALLLEDLTSNNNDLTNNNGVTEVTTGLPFVESTICADFEASSSQSLSIADGSQTGLDITGDITVEGWFKFESLPANGAFFRLVGKVATSNYSYSLFLYNAAGTYQIGVGISANGVPAGVTISTSPNISTGTWYHLAMTYDVSAHTAEAFQGGTSLGTADGTVTSIYNGTATFSIGRDDGGNYFDGLADEVRVWNTLRTQTEINDNKSSHISPASSGLVGYWAFETVGVAYTETYTDVITIAEVISKSETRVLTDVATIVDTIAKSTSRTMSDIVTVVDTISKQAGKVMSETITIAESFVRSIGKVVADEVTIAETITRNITRIFTDTVSISDTITKILNYIGKLPSYIRARIDPKPTGFSNDKDKPGVGVARAVDKPERF